jgi:hypothetical protein
MESESPAFGLKLSGQGLKIVGGVVAALFMGGAGATVGSVADVFNAQHFISENEQKISGADQSITRIRELEAQVRILTRVCGCAEECEEMSELDVSVHSAATDP